MRWGVTRPIKSPTGIWRPSPCIPHHAALANAGHKRRAHGTWSLNKRGSMGELRMALTRKAARQPGRYGFCQRGKHHYGMGILLHPHSVSVPLVRILGSGGGDRAEEREGGRAAKDGLCISQPSDLEWESVGAPVGRDER